VDLDTDIEVLSSQEISLIRREDTSQVGAATQALEGLGRGEGNERSRRSELGESNHDDEVRRTRMKRLERDGECWRRGLICKKDRERGNKVFI
jgi:hypothetical protein